MNVISQIRAVQLLRWSLGITFLWFGVLKLFNASPVLEIIKAAMPLMLGESQIFLLFLSVLEIALGVSFLSNKFTKIAAVVMTIHLLIVTISVLITQGFDPRFPILSLAGEFVVKNLVLIAAGLVLLTNGNKIESSHE